MLRAQIMAWMTTAQLLASPKSRNDAIPTMTMALRTTKAAVMMAVKEAAS
jgi:hypothetical protein